MSGQYNILAKLIFIGILLVFPGILLPVLTQVFMDDVLNAGSTSWFWGIVLFMSAAVLLQAGLTAYRGLILTKLQSKMTLISSYRFLEHLLKLPIGFFDQRYAGDISGRVDNNANVSVFLAGDLGETVLNLFVAVFYLVILIIYSPVLTLVSCLSAVFSFAAVKLSSSMISRIIMKYQQDSGKLMGAVCAGLSITSTLKASGTENEYVGRILGYNAKTVSTEQRLNRLQEIINSFPDALSQLISVVVILIGGMLIISGEFTVGMLVAFSSLFSSFMEPVNKLVSFVQKIQTVKADISRVEDITNYESDPKFAITALTENNPLSGEKSFRLNGNVELRDISFGYSKLEPPLVENFSFSLKSGKSIAFVGLSGCGKSTVSKVISGLYQPWSGEVMFDGKPMNKINKNILDMSISTVSQRITLFSGTIRDNITLWNNNILERDIVNAAKDACIHDTITSKPGAYDFVLSENANNLSGGQRQRLEIARALATNPSVLIMDEATSALDPIVEKEIIDNIKRRGCTCIIIAHRLSAIRDCDEIIVMEKGHIVQRGTHDDMIQVEGRYKEIIQSV